MRLNLPTVVNLAACLMLAGSAFAADLLPADRPIEEAVDHYVEALLKKNNVPAASISDEPGFLRRITLDLAGRTPTPAEAQAFVASSEPDKRVKWVDRLLAAPDFSLHQRNEFDTLLMGSKQNNEWRDYLLKSFQANKPWDTLFREMLLGREENADERPALTFLRERANELDDVTNDTSKLFFGVSINCAKCHDHPLVVDWTQDHFYGMSSFFNRTFVTKKKKFLAEVDNGVIRFKPLAEKEEKEAKLMFLTGAAIEEPAPPSDTNEDKKARDKRRKEFDELETPPPSPAFSRRAKLVEIALAPESRSFFSRSIVNRLWARLFGLGLVMPVDQMHSANPASHPELLEWLARDLVEHGYDLKRLVRGLVLSQTYARSSRWESAGERPAAKYFAVANVRPLSPRQFAMALQIATTSSEELIRTQEKPEDWAKRRVDLDNQSQGLAQRFEIPGDNFQVSVNEALLFSNSDQIQKELLRDGKDRLVGQLKTFKDKPAELIQTAFLATLSRPPQPDEIELFTKFLADRADRFDPAVQQLVWVLVTTGEFRFNY
ncbi:MAG: DUF1549 domain-containing protein [Planctomycetales bacterium]|nr:DUF1549 domain-containing protein [Planctomycetales bacterium]